VRYECLKNSRCNEDCVRIGKQGSIWDTGDTWDNATWDNATWDNAIWDNS
jgi:hypothetical protein